MSTHTSKVGSLLKRQYRTDLAKVNPFPKEPLGAQVSERVLIDQEHGLSSVQVSDNALSVVRDLQAAGYTAELVGGCVRDLMLGYKPKDFDVVTNAEPDQVQKLFRRARVIGRRFRLVHVLIGRSFVEVSTYRALPKEGVSQKRIHTERNSIVEDNLFGTRRSDASRRDFSINALYYDPVKNNLIDYVGGVSDVGKRFLRMIGDPEVRFREDPVRMLRAVRFVARLDLNMDMQIVSVMSSCAVLLGHLPPARLLDEVIKVFHCGHSFLAFGQLQKFNCFSELFPESTQSYTSKDLDPDRGLLALAFQSTDQRIRDDKPINSSFLFAVILWRAVSVESSLNRNRGVPPAEALHRATNVVIGRQQARLMIPRRMTTTISEMWNLQRWLEERRPRLIFKILAHKRFRAAYDMLMLRIAVGEVMIEVGSWWTKIQEADLVTQERMITELPNQRNRRKRRKARKHN